MFEDNNERKAMKNCRSMFEDNNERKAKKKCRRMFKKITMTGKLRKNAGLSLQITMNFC